MLSERVTSDGMYPRGWGLYAYTPGGKDATIAAPYPGSATFSERLAQQLYDAAGARNLLVAGAHRTADRADSDAYEPANPTLSTARMPDDNGGWRDGDTTAFEVTVWGKPAENAATRLRKGHLVQVIATRVTAEPWLDRDNAMRATMKLTATRVALVMNLDQQTERTEADRVNPEPPAAA